MIGSIGSISNTTKNVSSAIYKSFVRPHLVYPDIIYDKADKESFKDWLEKIQYNTALGVTAMVSGKSQGHIYNELDLQYLT